MVIVFDLDDTLYDEIDFVKSGFKEVAKYLADEKYNDFMIDLFYKEGSGKIFDRLIKKFNLDVNLQKLIEIYKFHYPNIFLPKESKELLDFSKSFKTALISDGHYIMQKNKYKKLKLQNYINFPIFTDFFHTKKPDVIPFKMVMDKYKTEKKFIYVSDNPKKDFIAPNKLGWITIRFKNPVGIYKDYPNDAMYEVINRTQIIEILRKESLC